MEERMPWERKDLSSTSHLPFQWEGRTKVGWGLVPSIPFDDFPSPTKWERGLGVRVPRHYPPIPKHVSMARTTAAAHARCPASLKCS